MKTLIFCLIFSCLLAFGQRNDVRKLDRNEAAQAWANITNLPPDTPTVSRGGLAVENELNGAGRRVWASFTQPGNYLLQGKTCDGQEVRLGEIAWELNPYTPIGGGLVLDTNKLGEAGNFLPQICSVEMIRLSAGVTQRSAVVGVASWTPTQTDIPRLQVGSEGIRDGRYYIATGKLPDDAVVIVGRTGVAAEIQRSPAGTVVLFPMEGVPSLVGPTIITLCSRGQCATTTYEKKVVVEAPGGKG